MHCIPRDARYVGLFTMQASFLSLLLASVASVVALPAGPHGATQATSSSPNPLSERSIFGPIDTGSANGITGGTVKSAAPPVSSFFAGLKPPVRYSTSRNQCSVLIEHSVPYKLLVGWICCHARNSHSRRSIPLRVFSRWIWCAVWRQRQQAV